MLVSDSEYSHHSFLEQEGSRFSRLGEKGHVKGHVLTHHIVILSVINMPQGIDIAITVITQSKLQYRGLN